MERRTTSKLYSNPDSPSEAQPIPECAHGMALRFTRLDKKTGTERAFYACSSSRDRKVCSLFHWVDDWERKLRLGRTIPSEHQVFTTKREKKARFDADLGVEALTDNATNAQFLFDRESIALIETVVRGYLKKDNTPQRVLCIGAPSVHKHLLGLKIDSVLLDEDERLESVLPHTIRFNMFNGNFFGNEKPEDTFGLVVIDPPFHPELLPVLFMNVKKIFQISFTHLVLFAFPYFHQSRVADASGGILRMTDIRMTYRNHKKYVGSERSPVRLYSNRDFITLIPTLGSDLYKICEPCNAFVYVKNKHCKDCNSCTSIAGKREFVHCRVCEKCVKQASHYCIGKDSGLKPSC